MKKLVAWRVQQATSICQSKFVDSAFCPHNRRDALLGPVFARALGTSDAEWARHLARLTDFWSSVMLRSGRYHGDPFSAHLRLPELEPATFDRWLTLFSESCADVLAPDVAEAFRDRAFRIACSLHMGLFERLPDKARRTAPP